MKIIPATIDNLEKLLPLFEGYRRFYQQASNTEVARKFLSNRFNKKDSVIFISYDDHEIAQGFNQLYPSFSSVAMQRIFILNDLFVHPKYRGKGIGKVLMNHAKKFALKKNSKGLTLETSIYNPAQRLYERLGWKKDTDVFHYTWEA
jgi:GNAT superfamily N-acetyltransferase|tara:strand:+ start:565 stop:1005 length:441 start_codon:yes stop_codon:yes gene_type:complete